MSLLSARDVSVSPPADGAEKRAAAPVVRGLSLELRAGEWLSVSGANGCGKTSALLALAGLWPVRSGEVRLDGLPFGPEAPRERRRDVAVLMQDPTSQLLQPTVREELVFSSRNLGRPESDVERALAAWSERFGLGGDLDRDPQHLSAGRQQLVLVAAALITRPRILFADEPAAHLDARARRLVLDAVREEVARGLAVLWVTQNDEERAAGQRAMTIAAGQLTSSQPPGETGPSIARPPGEPVAGASATEVEAPLLTLRVSASRADDGPRVAAPGGLEVPVARRGVTALEGPNASGKSVLLSVAAGLMRPEGVRAEWAGPAEPPPMLASQYPETEIFEEKVGDEVTYAAASRGVAADLAIASAARLFARFGLGDGFLERRTWSLSGGEKRLLSLVGALIAPASLIALDEPTAGLDDPRRSGLRVVVAEVAAETPVLVASQDGAWLDGLDARRFRLG